MNIETCGMCAQQNRIPDDLLALRAAGKIVICGRCKSRLDANDDDANDDIINDIDNDNDDEDDL